MALEFKSIAAPSQPWHRDLEIPQASSLGVLSFNDKAPRAPRIRERKKRFRSVLLLCSVNLPRIEQTSTDNVVIHYIFGSESLRVVDSHYRFSRFTTHTVFSMSGSLGSRVFQTLSDLERSSC